MSDILTRSIAHAVGATLGRALAPVTGRIPWVVRLGCALVVVGVFFLAVIILALMVA